MNEEPEVVVNPPDRREPGSKRSKANKQKRDAELDDHGRSQNLSGIMTMTSTSSDSLITHQSNRSRPLSADNLGNDKISETEELDPDESMEIGAEKENDKQRWNENLLAAYPPIPKGFIKKEPQDEDDHGEESEKVAYRPIPRSSMAIKEELTDHEEIAVEIHQQEEGGWNLVIQSVAYEAPNVAPFVDSQSSADHAGNGAKRLRATKLKRSSTTCKPIQQTTGDEMGSNNSRTLWSRSKMILSPTMDDGKATGKRKETDKMTLEQSDRREEHQSANCNAGKISEHSSLKDKDTARNSSDDVEPVAGPSKAVPSRPKKTAADHHEAGFEREKTSKRKISSAVNDASIQQRNSTCVNAASS